MITHKTKKLALFLMLIAAKTVSFAQMKIGGIPGPTDSSALLQLGDTTGTTKGILMPHVSITSTTLWGLTGTTPVTGMMVYNTNAAITGQSANGAGMYYWNGAQWVCANTSATVTNILGNNAPTGTATSGTVYTDTLPVSGTYGKQWIYNGGNWITYHAPVATEWYLSGDTNDAGGNKTTSIYRQGNVGIGTSNPSASLTIKGTNGKSGISMETSDTAAAISFNRNVNTGAIYNRSLGAFQLQSNSNVLRVEVYKPDNTSVTRHAMVVDTLGRVGVGTATPTALFEINNATPYAALKIADGTQGAGKVLMSDANGVAKWAAGSCMQLLSTYNGLPVALPNATFVTIPFNTIHNTNSPGALVNGVFTAPYSGIYLVSASTALDVVPGGGTTELDLFVNGIRGQVLGVAPPNFNAVMGTNMVYLTAGDVLTVNVLCYSSGVVNLVANNDWTYMNITKQ